MRNTLIAQGLVVLALTFATLPAGAQDVQPMTERQLIEELDIRPLSCPNDASNFNCVYDYLNEVAGKVDPFVSQRTTEIRTRIENAENAEREYDEIISLAKGIAELAGEGGTLTAQTDQIGKLIQQFRDDAGRDPELQDFVADYDQLLTEWEGVRDRLAEVRVDVLDVADELALVKRRAIHRIRIGQLREAIAELDDAVGGLESVLESLNTFADASAPSGGSVVAD